MKTDKEVIIDMFKRNNIDFKEENGAILVEAGYIGFVTEFTFNEEDNLKSVEAYE